MTALAATHKTDSDQCLLQGHDLHCVRGERSLFTGINVTVNRGQCLHIVGANGSGKTSLLRILCGLSSADSGTVLWRKQPLANNVDFNASTAYVGHKDGLKNELTAIENLRFQQQLEGINDEQALDDCLAQLKILYCADLSAQALSFGQRRRLAFARLLLSSKASSKTSSKVLWILDEPFTGIDIHGRALIEDLCVQHLSDGGAIVMTHHQSLDQSGLAKYRSELNLEAHGGNL